MEVLDWTKRYRDSLRGLWQAAAATPLEQRGVETVDVGRGEHRLRGDQAGVLRRDDPPVVYDVEPAMRVVVSRRLFIAVRVECDHDGSARQRCAAW